MWVTAVILCLGRAAANDPPPEPAEGERVEANATDAAVAAIGASVPDPQPYLDGIPVEALGVDDTWKGFNGSALDALRRARRQLPFNMQPDLQNLSQGPAPSTYTKHGDWNGWFFSFAPSQTQEKRALQGAKAEGFDDVLLRQLSQLGDEDTTPFYIDEVPVSVGLMPEKHFLKKKEVTAMVEWLVKQFERVGTNLTQMFGAHSVDADMFDASRYWAEFNRTGPEFHALTEQLRQELDASTNAMRVDVSGTVAQLDRTRSVGRELVKMAAWTHDKDHAIRSFVHRTKWNVTQLGSLVQKVASAANQDVGTLQNNLGTIQNKTMEEVQSWLQVYRKVLRRVYDRLRARISFNHDTYHEKLMEIYKAEAQADADDVADIRNASRTALSREAFVAVSARLLNKTIGDLMESQDLHHAQTLARVEAWTKMSRAAVKALQDKMDQFPSDLTAATAKEAKNALQVMYNGFKTATKLQKKNELQVLDMFTKGAMDLLPWRQLQKDVRDNRHHHMMGIASVQDDLTKLTNVLPSGDIDDEVYWKMKRKIQQGSEELQRVTLNDAKLKLDHKFANLTSMIHDARIGLATQRSNGMKGLLTAVLEAIENVRSKHQDKLNEQHLKDLKMKRAEDTVPDVNADDLMLSLSELGRGPAVAPARPAVAPQQSEGFGARLAQLRARLAAAGAAQAAAVQQYRGAAAAAAGAGSEVLSALREAHGVLSGAHRK